MPTSHVVSLDLVMYAAVILQCLFCHVLAYTIKANDVCLNLLVSPLTKWCFFHAYGLHNSMYYCINRWRTFKREKSTLCNNFIQKMGVSLFSGNYRNTNSLQHWPQLTTSNIPFPSRLHWRLSVPAYTGKFQGQLMPPKRRMIQKNTFTAKD